MLGWIFDASARTACRSFDAALGHMPYACLTDGGRPLLGLVACGMIGLLAVVLAVRALRR